MPWIRKNDAGTYRVYWREGGRGSPVKSANAGKTIAEARRVRDVIAGRIREGHIGGGVIAKRITVREFAEGKDGKGGWLAGRNIRPKSLERERYIVKNHILPRFDGDMVHAVTEEDAQAFITGLGREASVWTALRVHDVCRIMFGDARRYGYCRGNVFWNVRRPEKPLEEVRVPSVENFCKILAALPRTVRPFIVTLGLSATRYGEATALQWETPEGPDIDFDRSALHIRKQIVSNTTAVAPLKSKRSKRDRRRTVEVPALVRNALMDIPQRSRYVFPGARGGPLNHRAFVRRVWLPTVRGLKIGRVRLHDLRHFAASLWIAWGRNILWVAQQLGHGSADITLRQYGHLLREGQRLDEAETMRKIEDAYRSGERAAPVLPGRAKSGRGGRI